MSKKRHRTQPTIDEELVAIYHDLAHLDEKTRLKAAQKLLTKFIVVDDSSGSLLSEILRRLIRGLCSSNKAARLGFSVALTEVLTELFGPARKEVPEFQGIRQVLETLKTQTNISGNVSGQEERDHQFGRLFGAQSIIRSSILFHAKADLEAWGDLLDIICELARRKPWLREDCGFVLCNALRILEDKETEYSQLLLDKVHENQLTKSPEGIAIWISARSTSSVLKYPSNVWNHDNPLDWKERSSLARILKEDTLENESPDEEDPKVSQKGSWNTKSHFVWDVIISNLFHVRPIGKKSSEAEQISAKDFWGECVDKSLFASSSSEERKSWGFSLFDRAIQQAPAVFLPDLFGPNFMGCLMNQLASSERFLHPAAERATKSIIERSASSPETTIPLLQALLTSPSGGINFDGITKSKTVALLLCQISTANHGHFMRFYKELIFFPGTNRENIAASRRMLAADQLALALKSTKSDNASADLIDSILDLLAGIAYFDINNTETPSESRPHPPITRATRTIFRIRIEGCLAHVINKQSDHAAIAYRLIKLLEGQKKSSVYGPLLLESDDSVTKILTRAWNVVDSARVSTETVSSSISEIANLRSVVLLYTLAVLQVHNEDHEAVDILEDLNDIFDGRIRERHSTRESQAKVEILLNFLSRPSQLFRRMAAECFTCFASDMDKESLASMIEVLETEENTRGQMDLFEEDNDDGQDSREASDVEVMQLDGSGSAILAVEDGDDNDVSEESVNNDSHPELPDEELAAFNAKLAQALGTRLETGDPNADGSSSSDEDMDDEQMEALDEQLEKVFRERKKITSRKTEKREAKETIINFKSKILELLEIYIKRQHANGLALTLLMPLLTLIRTTTSKVVSSRACDLVKNYSKISKRRDLPKAEDVESIFECLEEIHLEAGKAASNAHASACSQASLIVVRVLMSHGGEHLQRVIKTYEATRERAESTVDTERKIKEAFFADWQNWFTSARK